MRDGSRIKVDLREVGSQMSKIIVFQLQSPVFTVTLPRFGSIAWPDFDTVSREIAKVIHYAIVESVAGSQQNDQHKNSPRNRKAGQEGAELVLPHRAPYLSQVIKI